MSISLDKYPNYIEAIKSRNTSLFPVVIIGNHAGNNTGSEWQNWLNNSIHISTNSFISDRVYENTNFKVDAKPLLVNIPSIKESIDVEERKYKISNVTLDISNLPYQGTRFSEMVGSSSLINTECRIYWVAPSTDLFQANDIYTWSDAKNVFQVYTGYVRKYEHSSNTAKITLEDQSQKFFDVEIPYESMGDNENIPESSKGKKIPMVFGNVKRSPCYISRYIGGTGDGGSIDFSTSNILIYADDINNNTEISFNVESLVPNGEMGNDDKGCLFIHSDIGYVGIPLSSSTTQAFEQQYKLDAEFPILTIVKKYYEDKKGNYPVNDRMEVLAVRRPDPPVVSLVREDYIPHDEEGIGYETGSYTYGYTTFSNQGAQDENFVGKIVNFTFKSTGLEEARKEDINAETMGNITQTKLGFNFTFSGDLSDDEDYNIYPNFAMAVRLLSEDDTVMVSKYKQSNAPEGTQPPVALAWNTLNAPEDIENDIGWEVSDHMGTDEPDDPFRYFKGNQIKTLQIAPITAFDYTWNAISGGSIHYYYGTIQDSIYILQRMVINDFVSNDLFANVSGRESGSPNVQNILSNLATSTGAKISNDMPSDFSNWKIDFTLTDGIKVKELIEKISSLSIFLPRFNHIGEFKIDKIPLNGGANMPNSVIKEEDVIDYTFQRTPIEKVYTKIEFNYAYDYALGKNTEKHEVTTGSIFGDSTSFFEYYGFKSDHSDSTLIIDDLGEYIQDSNTANEMAHTLLSWHCNQHIKIKVKLPLSYTYLEISDIVKFDKVIGGVLPYNIDYSANGSSLAGNQAHYKEFIVTNTNKTMTHIELECVQLHQLVSSGTDQPIQYGCYDSEACNFVDEACPSGWNCVNYGCYYPSNCADGTTTCESCEDLPPSETDCEGTPGGNAVEDCAGECGGDAVYDECGVCGGDGVSEEEICPSPPNGTSDPNAGGCVLAECDDSMFMDHYMPSQRCADLEAGIYGVHENYNGSAWYCPSQNRLLLKEDPTTQNAPWACYANCHSGCDGEPCDCTDSDLEFDECGVCGGDGIPWSENHPELGLPCCDCDCTKVVNCNGYCLSTTHPLVTDPYDECGVCGGDGTSCSACTDPSFPCCDYKLNYGSVNDFGHFTFDSEEAEQAYNDKIGECFDNPELHCLPLDACGTCMGYAAEEDCEFVEMSEIWVAITQGKTYLGWGDESFNQIGYPDVWQSGLSGSYGEWGQPFAFPPPLPIPINNIGIQIPTQHEFVDAIYDLNDPFPVWDHQISLTNYLPSLYFTNEPDPLNPPLIKDVWFGMDLTLSGNAHIPDHFGVQSWDSIVGSYGISTNQEIDTGAPQGFGDESGLIKIVENREGINYTTLHNENPLVTYAINEELGHYEWQIKLWKFSKAWTDSTPDNPVNEDSTPGGGVSRDSYLIRFHGMEVTNDRSNYDGLEIGFPVYVQWTVENSNLEFSYTYFIHLKWVGSTQEFENTGYCMGDLNNDGGHNILDIVALANCVLAGNCTSNEQWNIAGDMNQDGGFNVLDIVALANCVLSGTCINDEVIPYNCENCPDAVDSPYCD